MKMQMADVKQAMDLAKNKKDKKPAGMLGQFGEAVGAAASQVASGSAASNQLGQQPQRPSNLSDLFNNKKITPVGRQSEQQALESNERMQKAAALERSKNPAYAKIDEAIASNQVMNRAMASGANPVIDNLKSAALQKSVGGVVNPPNIQFGSLRKVLAPTNNSATNNSAESMKIGSGVTSQVDKYNKYKNQPNTLTPPVQQIPTRIDPLSKNESEQYRGFAGGTTGTPAGIDPRLFKAGLINQSGLQQQTPAQDNASIDSQIEALQAQIAQLQAQRK